MLGFAALHHPEGTRPGLSRPGAGPTSPREPLAGCSGDGRERVAVAAFGRCFRDWPQPVRESPARAASRARRDRAPAVHTPAPPADDLLVDMAKMRLAASREARVAQPGRPVNEWAMSLGREHEIRGPRGGVQLRRPARRRLRAGGAGRAGAA